MAVGYSSSRLIVPQPNGIMRIQVLLISDALHLVRETFAVLSLLTRHTVGRAEAF